jgi:DNA-binding NtrC family response regulator
METTPIWIVGSEHWERALLRAELIERGYDAVGFVTLREALVRLALASQRPALVVVDLHEQQLNDRQLTSLLSAGFPVLAIGGATEWEDQNLNTRPWAKFLRRPLTIGSVAAEVDRLVAARAR